MYFALREISICSGSSRNHLLSVTFCWFLFRRRLCVYLTRIDKRIKFYHICKDPVHSELSVNGGGLDRLIQKRLLYFLINDMGFYTQWDCSFNEWHVHSLFHFIYCQIICLSFKVLFNKLFPFSQAYMLMFLLYLLSFLLSCLLFSDTLTSFCLLFNISKQILTSYFTYLLTWCCPRS